MKAVVVLTTLILASTIACAGAVDLTCGGVMHTYQATHIQGSVAPGATIVDLEQRRITTPVGSFRVIDISEDSITFDDPREKQLIVFGTLDRLSGLMRIFWRNPQNSTKMARYAELNCSIAKRLF